MRNYYLICRSVTYAQRTAKVLERSGISALVSRTPKEIAPEGCSYSVRVPEWRMGDALVALRASDMPPARVYSQFEDGSFYEVRQ